MKKKFLTGLLSVSMAAAMLTGCGGSKAPAEDKAQTEEADDTEEAAEAEEAGEEEAGDDGEEASADEAQAAIDERKAEAEENGEWLQRHADEVVFLQQSSGRNSGRGIH